jgi:hypothetical protein
MLKQNVEIAGSQGDQAVTIRQREVSEAIDTRHLRMAPHRFFYFWRNRRLHSNVRARRWTQIKIGAESLLHPIDHGLPETSDHHGDGRQHRQAHRQCSHRNGDSRYRARQIGQGQPPFDSSVRESMPQPDNNLLAHPARRMQDAGAQKGCSENNGQCGSVSE